MTRGRPVLYTHDDILGAIKAYQAKHGYPPSVRDIADMVGSKSASPIKRALAKMRADGLVTYEPNKARTVQVVEVQNDED